MASETFHDVQIAKCGDGQLAAVHVLYLLSQNQKSLTNKFEA